MSLHDHVETMKRVHALLQATPELQGREHVSLGTAFNRAIDELSALAGQAVAWRVANHPNGPFALRKTEPTGWAVIEPLYTHPAGAVQVTDEMVSRMVEAFGRDPGWSLLNDLAKREKARAYLTAALNPGGSRE